MTHLCGIFVPNIVPYDAQGRIHEEELRRIIRWLAGKGVTGFYPNGSMGEFIRLSYEERKRVLKIVVEESAGKPVLAGAAEPNVDLVLEMCRYCADLGCRAVSITGPYYYKLTQESIEAYFRELAAKSPIDIVIYNIPAFANEISVPVLKRLALDCPRVIGTKDTSRDMPRFQQVLHEIKPQRPEFSVLIGWEELLCASLFMGGDGGTLSSAGVVPEVIMKIHQDARAGDWVQAKRAQFKLLDLFSLMVNAPNFPEGFRAGYEVRGFAPGRARFPLSQGELAIMEEVRSRIACVLAECGFPEAAGSCRAASGVVPLSAAPSPADVESMVRSVMQRLSA
ncbi:MAG: dihydrodipicolinate synthase family protein [Verrucomicrobia bacterium]|jgi:4-hydroxy-tetrahydrodipicolinate synthase|nr:dihydrodipicolinate synthase family protein [Verrucomicrobiota bacterium]